VNKFLIPVILTSIILVAGFSVFIPVNTATAVHNVIIAAINAINEELMVDHDQIFGNITEIDGNITQIHGNVTQLHGNHTFILGNITDVHDWVMTGHDNIDGNITQILGNQTLILGNQTLILGNQTLILGNLTDIDDTLDDLDFNLGVNFTEIAIRHTSIDNDLVDIEGNVTISSAFVMTQSDMAFVDVGAGEKAYCGSTGEPWMLNIAASSDADGGTVRIKTNDADTVTFAIANNTSFSASFAFGGADDGITEGDQVDNVVEILGTGIPSMIVTALATFNSIDPFSGDGETDNYCINDPDEFSLINFGMGNVTLITE